MKIGELLKTYSGHGVIIEADTWAWENCIKLPKYEESQQHLRDTKYDNIEVKSFYSEHDWIYVDIGVEGWKKINKMKEG